MIDKFGLLQSKPFRINLKSSPALKCTFLVYVFRVIRCISDSENRFTAINSQRYLLVTQSRKQIYLNFCLETAEEHRDNSLPGKNDAGSRHNEAINNSAKVQLEREWIAFQKMEHERQFRELNKRVHSSPHRETKEERKLREVGPTPTSSFR